jgi:predicted AAA+ superfamily ATPase
MKSNLWEGYVIEDIIHTLGDKYSYYFYRTADGAECDLIIFNGLRCIAAIDAKFSANPKKSRSMTISIQNVNPDIAYFVVPDCQIPYKISEKTWVITPAQLLEKL